MFYFGDIPRESRVGNARFAPPEEEMLLFFSRRIGLTDTGEQIPIVAGGRLTGRVGRIGVGAMTIQTEVARAPGRATTTPCCAAGATSCATPTSARSSCRASRPAPRPIATRWRASTRTSGSCGRSASTGFSRGRSRQAWTAARWPGRDRRLERQLRPHAVFVPEHRRQFPRRHRVHQADRRPQALRRLRRPASAPSGSASTASANSTRICGTTSTRTSRVRRCPTPTTLPRRVFFERGGLHRDPVESALRADRDAVQGAPGSGVRAGQLFAGTNT